ncbi:MAG: hypothetical protein PHH82_01940 [Candidatus ainarchaeum sp.]|nr:hypothetical protein [Candidatus ainarchaeum sp.]
MKKYLKILIPVMFAVTILLIAFFAILYSLKSSDYDVLVGNYNLLEFKYNSLVGDFNALSTQYAELLAQYSELQTKYYELVEEYKSLNLEYNKALDISAELTDKLYSAKEELNGYKIEVQSSLDWFKENATLESKSIKSKLDSKCISSTAGYCTIAEPCLDLVNEQFMGLEYKDDTTLGKTDKFISIDEFLENKGGDCEDFSLLFKAEINYLLEKCSGKEIKVEAFVTSDSGNYFLDNSNSWYYANAKKHNLIAGYIYPNIVCGVLKDPNKADVFGGHCVIAFSKEKIESLLDLEKLNLAELVEPQTGQYLGRMKYGSTTFNVEYYVEGEYFPESVSYIKQIITDNDYYLYQNGWKGYESIYDMFITLEQEIDSILEKQK